jgi:hypothetical protein
LVAVLPRNRFTFPLLAFTGTGLITARFPPWLLGQVTQTALRYGPPILMDRRDRGDERRRRAGVRRRLEQTEPLGVGERAESGRFARLV